MTRTGARRAVAELSVRGRAFIAAGATAIACGVVLGQSALVGAGIFACAVPVVSLITLRSSRFDVRLRRDLRPGHVTVGVATRVSLTLASHGRAPRRQMLLEDRVPYVLGPRSRIVVHDLPAHGSTTVTYDVRSDVRGRYEIGPLRVHVRDAYGMVDLVREFNRSTQLTVRPRVQPLPRIHLEGGSGASGEERPRAAATGSAEDVTVREYRRGDDLRRVHWRTTARTGELMVRREEDPLQAHATVFIDNRSGSHSGTAVGSSFERAVELAASICTHLAHEGYTVHLLDADGDVAVSTPASGAAAPALDKLAVIGLTPRTDLARFAEHSRTGERHVTVALLGRSRDGDAAPLAGVARRGTTTVAAVLDVDRWRTPGEGQLPARAPGEGPVPRWLGRQGWRHTAVAPQDPPAAVWRRLGTGGRR